MKYIKKFEDNIMHIDDSKFKEGDYVMSNSTNIKGIISEVLYNYINNTSMYHIKGSSMYNKEENLKKMTPEQIEIYEFEKATNKFNI